MSEEEKSRIWESVAKAGTLCQDYLLAARFYAKCDNFTEILKLPFDSDERVDLVRLENEFVVEQLIRIPNKSLSQESPELLLSLTLGLFVQGRTFFICLHDAHSRLQHIPEP